jgi:hypothetical protein
MEKVEDLILRMEQASCDIDVSECGYLPGMFCLAAHRSAAVRACASARMLSKLQKIPNNDAFVAVLHLEELFDKWVCSSRPEP